MEVRNLPIIGRNTLLTVAGIEKIPAKIDTGADSSSIWASNITVNPSGQLKFTLLGPESSLYTGEHLTLDEYRVRRVRNSTGQVSIRYCVKLPIIVEGKRMRANFTLADRSKNNFPILLGRKTIKNRFLVDVAVSKAKKPPKFDNSDLETELTKDPHKFHTRLYRLYEKQEGA